MGTREASCTTGRSRKAWSRLRHTAQWPCSSRLELHSPKFRQFDHLSCPFNEVVFFQRGVQIRTSLDRAAVRKRAAETTASTPFEKILARICVDLSIAYEDFGETADEQDSKLITKEPLSKRRRFEPRPSTVKRLDAFVGELAAFTGHIVHPPIPPRQSAVSGGKSSTPLSGPLLYQEDVSGHLRAMDDVARIFAFIWHHSRAGSVREQGRTGVERLDHQSEPDSRDRDVKIPSIPGGGVDSDAQAALTHDGRKDSVTAVILKLERRIAKLEEMASISAHSRQADSVSPGAGRGQMERIAGLKGSTLVIAMIASYILVRAALDTLSIVYVNMPRTGSGDADGLNRTLAERSVAMIIADEVRKLVPGSALTTRTWEGLAQGVLSTLALFER